MLRLKISVSPNIHMRANHVTPAIVLRSRPFGESDKIVSFLSENYGKLTGIAKGAMRSRKRFANSLEPFALVNLSFQDRPNNNLAFILAADLKVGFRQLLTSLDRISYAAYLVEITDGLIGEREENPAIYQHLKYGLAYLEENGASLRFLTFFELRLLRLAGYQPLLDGCKRCHKARLEGRVSQWNFSPFDGGIVCDPCSCSRHDILPLGAAAVEVLSALQDSATLPAGFSLHRSVVQEIRSVMLRFIQYHVDREIKSAIFLSQFSDQSGA
jgi:DNA repair protein RecO (recombination protein O)